MKAMVLNAVGEQPVLTEVELPKLEAGEVLVKLKAAALNHRDVYITQGLYPAIKTPSILGSDGVGELDGKRVVLLPGLKWGDRDDVQALDYEVLGMPHDGTFAEYIAIPEASVYPCPEHLTDAEAAAFPLAGLTGYRALMTRASAKTSDTVLVTGAGGGVATMVIQLAVALGCAVYVTSSSTEKIAFAKTLGAKGGVNYTDDDWIDQLKGMTEGLDVVVDGAGGEGFSKLSKLMKPGGRMAFYGGTRGTIPKLNPQVLFWRQVTIAGSTMGSPKEFEAMLTFVSKHKIRPVVDSVRPLEELPAALARMDAGEQRGKLVVTMEGLSS